MPFQILRNDITKMEVDAIVNTASPLPDYGLGTDTAVYEAAGVEELLAKRKEIGIIERGASAITPGYKLPAKYIIHTVGTAWEGGDKGEEEILKSCYRSVFKIALENDINSLAFPLLASGCYGFPRGLALKIALSEIEAFMSDHDMELYLVVFDEKTFSISSELYGDIDEYINDNYVAAKTVEEYDLDFDLAGDSAENFMGGFPEGYAEEVREIKPAVEPRRLFSFGRPAKTGAEPAKRSERKAAKGDGAVAESQAMLAEETLPSYDTGRLPVISAPMAPGRNLDDVIKNLDKTFMEMVFSFADERGMTDVEVQKRANLDRKAFSKLKCGTTKNPSKATALALAVALRLSLDDTKDLLSRAGLALSPCSKQDLIVRYFIEHEIYDVFAINIALFDHGEPPIGNQADK